MTAEPQAHYVRLAALGYVPGDRISRNLGPHFAAGSLGVITVLVASQWRWLTSDDLAPFLVFLSIATTGFAGVVAWHATRPPIVFHTNGLMIAGDMYVWSRIASIQLDDFSGTVLVIGTDGAGHARSFRAVRRRP